MVGFARHVSFVLCDGNELFAFGNNDCGDLVRILFVFTFQGLNSNDLFVANPTQVSFFVGKAQITDVQVGCGFSMVQLKNGCLYAMGNRNYCGQYSDGHFFSPVSVNVGNQEPVISVACSRKCTFVQTVNKQWFMFGNAVGSTNHLTATRADTEFPTNVSVQKIVASGNVFFMLCDNGDLYVIGHGEKGEMGMNNRANIDKWTLCKQSVDDVQAGLFNSFIFLKDTDRSPAPTSLDPAPTPQAEFTSFPSFSINADPSTQFSFNTSPSTIQAFSFASFMNSSTAFSFSSQ